MIGEALNSQMDSIMSGASNIGEHGLSNTKALIGAILLSAGGTGAVVKKMSGSATGPDSVNGLRVKTLKQGYRGLRHRRGVYDGRVVQPGLTSVLSIFRGYDKVNLKDVTTPLALLVESEEERKHLIEAKLTWGHPEDDGHGKTKYDIPYNKILEKALLRARSEGQLDEAIGGIALDGLRLILNGKKSQDLLSLDSEKIQEELIAAKGKILIEDYSAEIRRLTFGNTTTASIPIDHYRPGRVSLAGIEDVQEEDEIGSALLGDVASAPHLRGL